MGTEVWRLYSMLNRSRALALFVPRIQNEERERERKKNASDWLKHDVYRRRLSQPWTCRSCEWIRRELAPSASQLLLSGITFPSLSELLCFLPATIQNAAFLEVFDLVLLLPPQLTPNTTTLSPTIPASLSPRAHLRVVGMLRLMFLTSANQACPLLFYSVLVTISVFMALSTVSVSYTHLTLPTRRTV